jgi:hypothetical protein
MEIFNKHRIILDLCGGSGAWSKPYREAGYDVRIIDPLENNQDVRLMVLPEYVAGKRGRSIERSPIGC